MSSLSYFAFLFETHSLLWERWVMRLTKQLWGWDVCLFSSTEIQSLWFFAHWIVPGFHVQIEATLTTTSSIFVLFTIMHHFVRSHSSGQACCHHHLKNNLFKESFTLFLAQISCSPNGLCGCKRCGDFLHTISRAALVTNDFRWVFSSHNLWHKSHSTAMQFSSRNFSTRQIACLRCWIALLFQRETDFAPVSHISCCTHVNLR